MDFTLQIFEQIWYEIKGPRGRFGLNKWLCSDLIDIGKQISLIF